MNKRNCTECGRKSRYHQCSHECRAKYYERMNKKDVIENLCYNRKIGDKNWMEKLKSALLAI